MRETKTVKGYKVFNPDWTCRNKQYTCPGKFEEDVNLSICSKGMHFCREAADCFDYYSFDPNNKVAEVIAYGSIEEKDNKCCTDKLEIIREIPWAELLEMVNTGKECTGYCNSGNYNSGNRNSGNCNSGNRNSGNCNSGDWNNTNHSNGCFNTMEPTIYLFDKPSNWTYCDWGNSKARHLLMQIPRNGLVWVSSNHMSDEEKARYPEHETTGGYLKELDTSECAVKWWRNLDDEDKTIIMTIPNFDKEIFKEITGIDVDED